MRSAFSLIELMIVIVILGLIAAVVLPNVTGKGEQARQKLACVQMKTLSQSLKMFKIDNGRYPTTEEGLKALIENPSPDTLKNYSPKGYLEDKKIPLDPWKNEYVYTQIEDGFEIISLGADKKEGGNGENEDIYLSKCQ